LPDEDLKGGASGASRIGWSGGFPFHGRRGASRATRSEAVLFVLKGLLTVAGIGVSPVEDKGINLEKRRPSLQAPVGGAERAVDTSSRRR